MAMRICSHHIKLAKAHNHLKSPFQTFRPSVKPSFQASIIAHAVKKRVLASIKGCAAIHWLRSHLHMQPSQAYAHPQVLNCNHISWRMSSMLRIQEGSDDGITAAIRILEPTLLSLSSNESIDLVKIPPADGRGHAEFGQLP